MTCSQVPQELSASTPGVRPSWRVRRHLARCAACAAAASQMTALEEQVRAWRSDAPPAYLEARIAASLPSYGRPFEWQENDASKSVEEHRRTETMWSTPQFTLALSAVALAAVLTTEGVVSLHHRTASASTPVRSAHIIVWYQPKDNWEGPLPKTDEIWYQAGAWRRQSANQAPTITTGGKRYRYDHWVHRLASATEALETRQAFTTPDFSPTRIASYYTPQGATLTTRPLGMARLNGRVLRQMSVNSPGERMLFWVDPATGLPVRAEKQDRDGGKAGWGRPAGVFQFEFNTPLPAALFDPQTLER